MIETYSIPLTDVVRDFKLEVAYASADYESIRLTVDAVSRPGLQIAGYFDYFEPIDPALVPKNSILREFIGGGSYRYK